MFKANTKKYLFSKGIDEYFEGVYKGKHSFLLRCFFKKKEKAAKKNLVKQ